MHKNHVYCDCRAKAKHRLRNYFSFVVVVVRRLKLNKCWRTRNQEKKRFKILQQHQPYAVHRIIRVLTLFSFLLDSACILSYYFARASKSFRIKLQIICPPPAGTNRILLNCPLKFHNHKAFTKYKRVRVFYFLSLSLSLSRSLSLSLSCSLSLSASLYLIAFAADFAPYLFFLLLLLHSTRKFHWIVQPQVEIAVSYVAVIIQARF